MSGHLVLTNNSGLLQEVLVNPGTLDSSVLVEVDVNVFPEPAGVIVPHSLSVAKS